MAQQNSQEKFLTHNVMDLFSLKGRTVAITGVAEAGGKVAILDAASRPHEHFKILEQKTKANYYQANVTDYDGLASAFQRLDTDFGGLHGCITAAGVCPVQPFLERPWQDVKRCFDINVLGTYYAAQLAGRSMERTAATMREGSVTTSSIVMIGSVATHRASVGQFTSDYCASKGAVLSLARELGVELAERRIRVNCVSPGYIRTDLTLDIAKRRPELASLMHSEPPMKRMGDRVDLKGAAVYLLSEASAYMTGGEILVTGGIHAGRIR
ncbi:uncharacterized protein BDV14DRAFT_188992 [Aspergillus stella-maris]|uniref:uncharacterized protein n=1 Tax=Aspergillus stella-maris TaxID=1810926 RepID=UPI003CCCC7D1